MTAAAPNSREKSLILMVASLVMVRPFVKRFGSEPSNLSTLGLTTFATAALARFKARYAGEPVHCDSPPSLPAIATVAGIFSASAIGALAPSMAGTTLVALVLPACWLTAVVMPFTGAGIAPNGVTPLALA